MPLDDEKYDERSGTTQHGPATVPGAQHVSCELPQHVETKLLKPIDNPCGTNDVFPGAQQEFNAPPRKLLKSSLVASSDENEINSECSSCHDEKQASVTINESVRTKTELVNKLSPEVVSPLEEKDFALSASLSDSVDGEDGSSLLVQGLSADDSYEEESRQLLRSSSSQLNVRTSEETSSTLRDHLDAAACLDRSDLLEETPEIAPRSLLLVGGYTPPVKVEVKTSEVYEGIVVDDDGGPRTPQNEILDLSTGWTCRKGPRCLSTRLARVFGCLVAIAVIAIIVVAIVMTPSSDKNVRLEADQVASLSPTRSPTEAPTPYSTDLLTVLERLQAKGFLVQNNTAVKSFHKGRPIELIPQMEAARWMADHDTPRLSDEEWYERYALAVFFFSTFGDPIAWVHRCGFLDTENHICEWKCPWPDQIRAYKELIFNEHASEMGVYCDDGQMRVTHVQLPINSLTGYVPSELRLLSRLRVLNLASNSVQGDLHLEYLPASLQHLLMQYNFFTTRLNRESLSHLTMLETLQFSLNEAGGSEALVEGGLPTAIGLLTALRRVYIESMNLTGSLPTQIGSLTALETLLLSQNDLTGSVPSEISTLTSLKAFAIDENPNLYGDISLCESIAMDNSTSEIVDFRADCFESALTCLCCSICCDYEGKCDSI